MIKAETIPTLKGNKYYQSYFRHQPTQHAIAISSDRYFEIHRKCAWRSDISAHRLDFYMIFLVTKGEGIHTFGLKEHYIRKNMLCFVGPDMISSWKAETDDHQGYFCTFSDEFFGKGNLNKHFLQELSFFQIDGNPVLELSDAQTEYYRSLFTLMYDEFENKNEYSDAILRSQLQVILNKAYSQYKTHECKGHQTNHAGLRLLKAFNALYLRDFKLLGKGNGLQLKKVSEYANELGVSQNHLNDTIKAVTGRSAGELIKNQLTRQATMCLMHASKSISEIAYTLGFEDPSYFARFYKNQTGMSPSAFRSMDNP